MLAHTELISRWKVNAVSLITRQDIYIQTIEHNILRSRTGSLTSNSL